MNYNAQMIQLYKKLPSFANNENKELNRHLQKEFREFKNLIAECEDLQNRVNTIKQQQVDSEKWISGKRNELNLLESQIDEESHKISLIKAERGGIKTDIDNYREKTSSIEWKTREIQLKIKIAEDRIIFFEGKAQENSELLDYFQKILAENEELLIVLQKNNKEDSITVKNMVSQIEKQENLLNNMKKRLDDEVSTTKTFQTELNTFSPQYQKIYDENKHILHMIDTQISTLKSLKEEIQEKSSFCKKIQEKYQKIFDVNQIEKQNLDQILKENKVFDLQIKDLYNKVNLATNELDSQENQLNENLQNIETLTYNLLKLQNDENFYKNQIQKIDSDIQVEMNKKLYYQKRLDEINAIYESRTDFTAYLQEIKLNSEKLLEETQKELNERDKLITEYKNNKDKLIDKRLKLQNKIIDLKNDKNTKKHVCNALTHKIDELSDEVQSQESKNNQIYQIQKRIESKIEKIETKSNETNKFQEEINALREISKQSKEKMKNTKSKIEEIQIFLNKKFENKNKLNQEKNKLENIILELEQEISINNKLIFESNKTIRDKRNEFKILKMKFINLYNSLEKISEIKIFEENKKSLLFEFMKLRQEELEREHSSLVSEFNSSSKSINSLKKEISKNKNQIELKKSEYIETTQNILENEDNTFLTVSKEMESLIQRRSELEQKIKNAINETNAIERATNKLQHINSSTKYKEKTEKEMVKGEKLGKKEKETVKEKTEKVMVKEKTEKVMVKEKTEINKGKRKKKELKLSGKNKEEKDLIRRKEKVNDEEIDEVETLEKEFREKKKELEAKIFYFHSIHQRLSDLFLEHDKKTKENLKLQQKIKNLNSRIKTNKIEVEKINRSINIESELSRIEIVKKKIKSITDELSEISPEIRCRVEQFISANKMRNKHLNVHSLSSSISFQQKSRKENLHQNKIKVHNITLNLNL